MTAAASPTLADLLDDALPQTQCTRCGYADCRAYAEAMAAGADDIHHCPPGGAEGIQRLARLTGRPPISLDPQNGQEGPRLLAVIDEAWCIGCTLCIKACPVDCIVGASKQMHTVIDSLCTGCELCVPACPVDCIALVPVSGDRSGWAAWSNAQAHEARTRYAAHRERLARDQRQARGSLEAAEASLVAAAPAAVPTAVPAAPADGSSAADAKRAVIEAMLARAGPTRQRQRVKTADIGPFFATLAAANPHPVSELEYSSVFELLAAVLLSAQATDAGVNKATRRLFPVANTPQKILALGEEGLSGYIRTIGLYRSKAKHLMQACRLLIERHGGEVPRDREALEALPGVGRKTANVVLNVAFGEPTMAVDTHVFRVANRTGLAPGRNPLDVERRLLKRVPAQYLPDAHHWLILHGRYVCQAKKPQCARCAVAAYCDAYPLDGSTPR